MLPIGDITYESQLFRAYGAPTAAVWDFHSKCILIVQSSNTISHKLPVHKERVMEEFAIISI